MRPLCRPGSMERLAPRGHHLRLSGYNLIVDFISVGGLAISAVAAAISVLAWKAARSSADAAERQALEASRSVQISQTVALHDAQLKAQESIPRTSVRLEDPYQSPCVLIPYGRADDTEAMIRPAPETLDPIRKHRIDFLGKRFRGILVNYDTRPIAVMADPGLFVEGITPLWEEPIDLPRMQSAGRYILDPGRAALFEWFGSCTVIDWYELARMPPAEASAACMGIHIPCATITVNYAGDEQWALPGMCVTLKIDRLPVYFPRLGIDDGILLLLGHEGVASGATLRPNIQECRSSLKTWTG